MSRYLYLSNEYLYSFRAEYLHRDKYLYQMSTCTETSKYLSLCKYSHSNKYLHNSFECKYECEYLHMGTCIPNGYLH